MDDRLASVVAMFDSNATVFRGAMADVSESAWLHRPGEANHLAFLAEHLVGARHFTVGLLGGSSTDPLEAYHGHERSIEGRESFASAEETLDAWNEVAPLLMDALNGATPESLDADSGMPFPAPGPTLLDTLIFLAQHETYHLGQMGLLRRAVGLAATEWR